MIQVRQCPICTSSTLTTIFTATDYVVSGERFNILECNNCRSRLTSPIPEENELHRYYESEDYIPHSESLEGLSGRIYRVIQRLMLVKKRRLTEKMSGLQRGSLLDIGCGTGEFLNTMRSAGWEVDGIDASSAARAKARKKYDLEVRSPEQWLDDGGSQYDAVTFWHALEHLYNLDLCLRKVCSCLKSGGVIVIGVPNYHSFDADYYQGRWAAYDVPRHLYHFAYDAMTTLLRRNGLLIAYASGLPFDSFYISMLSEWYEGGSALRGAWVGLRSNFRARNNVKKWSSIVYVAKRDENSQIGNHRKL